MRLSPHYLHYPNDVDRSLNEDVTDKIRKYRADVCVCFIATQNLCEAI
jgi:hypothetical protein